MQTNFLLWDKIIAGIRKGIPKFKAVNKADSKMSKLIAKLAFWSDYMQVTTTRYPNVYLPDREPALQRNPRTLQHEWVHLKDQQTFFGLLKFMPAKINWLLFAAAYIMPQLLALLAVFAIWNPWWLLCLAFAAPIPSPFRMISEVRGYRRSRELGVPVEHIAEIFIGKKYYYMWPFKKQIIKMLSKPSPYRDEMDKVVRGE